ncbi:MAG: response regulator transcription factor [Planctomycetota bacterium]
MAKSTAPRKASAQSEFSQPKKRRPFTVFLIIDDRSVRESLAAALKGARIDVRDYMTAMEFCRDFREDLPGVVFAEVNLRGMSGLELANKLQAEKKNVPVTALTGHAEVPDVIRAMQDNVLDFLLKPVHPERLIQLVARAYAYYYDVDWDFVGEDLDSIQAGLNLISAREHEVLDLLVEGYSSREIASQIGVSTKTVEAHRARINDKLRSEDLAHLVRMVMASREAS